MKRGRGSYELYIYRHVGIGFQGIELLRGRKVTLE